MRLLRQILFVLVFLVSIVLGCTLCYWAAFYAMYWIGPWAAFPIGIASCVLTVFACSIAWQVAGFVLLGD